MQVRFHGVREVSSLAGDPPHPLRPPAHPTKQTPSTNQKSTVQTTPTTYRNKPHQQTRNQQFHQILEPTKQTPSTNQKSTVQTNQKVQVLLLLRRSTHTPSQEGWVFTATFCWTPCRIQQNKTNPINRPEINSSNNSYDLQKQTPSTKQKTTVHTEPTT